MKYLKRFMLVSLVSFVIFLLLMFLATLLNYFDVISIKVMNVLKVIIPLFSLTIGGFLLGKKAVKNGYLEGVKLGAFFIFVLSFLNLIIFEVGIKDIVFYILLVVCCVFGSMIGINVRKEK